MRVEGRLGMRTMSAKRGGGPVISRSSPSPHDTPILTLRTPLRLRRRGLTSAIHLSTCLTMRPARLGLGS
jgi:hypothetical protein